LPSPAYGYCEAELLAEAAELFLPSGRQPQLGRRDVMAGPEHRAERPGYEVTPVVEVEVRDHDRIDPGPALLRAKSWEHARPAVEQDPS